MFYHRYRVRLLVTIFAPNTIGHRKFCIRVARIWPHVYFLQALSGMTRGSYVFFRCLSYWKILKRFNNNFVGLPAEFLLAKLLLLHLVWEKGILSVNSTCFWQFELQFRGVSSCFLSLELIFWLQSGPPWYNISGPGRYMPISPLHLWNAV